MLPTPTLQDLLNPVPADNTNLPLSSAKELYGATFDEGDDDESLPITFIWGANLERLMIETLVNLANPKVDCAIPGSFDNLSWDQLGDWYC